MHKHIQAHNIGFLTEKWDVGNEVIEEEGGYYDTDGNGISNVRIAPDGDDPFKPKADADTKSKPKPDADTKSKPKPKPGLRDDYVDVTFVVARKDRTDEELVDWLENSVLKSVAPYIVLKDVGILPDRKDGTLYAMR